VHEELTETGRRTRARIIDAAMTLLVDGGREAVSTRAVSQAAGVQPPAIYRLFGDKQGLLDAVAADGFAAHLSDGLARQVAADPVADLRRAWDLHVDFGIRNPYLYSLAYGGSRPGHATAASEAAATILAGPIRRAAEAGMLGVSESDARDVFTAASCGTTLTLIAMPEHERGTALSHRTREAVLASILSGAGPTVGRAAITAAVQLRATLDDATVLTSTERQLLGDWLDRIASHHTAGDRGHGGAWGTDHRATKPHSTSLRDAGDFGGSTVQRPTRP
jgi:AcrR family transcriptional regulator